MKEIYQILRSKGLLQEIKSFKTSSGSNAFMVATWNGHLDICKFLVREDLVDVNAKNVSGSNALYYAAMYNRPEMAKLLLEETTIDVNEQTNRGSTALHEAALWNGTEVTRILLKYKSRLLKDKDGDTPLDVAREEENEEIIQLLNTHYNM